MGYKNIIYLVSLPILLVIIKWLINFYYLEELIFELKLLLNFNDKQYFPFIISLSNFDFSPSHNDFYRADGVTTFPYASLIYHALLFKFFDLSSIIVGELIFYTLAYLLIYYFLRKSGIKEITAILSTFLIFFSPAILEFIIFFFGNINIENIKDIIFDYHLVSLRFPRPLVTDLYFYLSLIVFLSFFKNKFNSKLDYLLFGIIISLLLQSFIFLFFVIGFSYLVILFNDLIKNKKSIKEIIKYNSILLFSFLLISIPFILQNIYAEQDYIQRIGLFEIDFNDKRVLLSETVIHYFNLKNLLYISTVIIFYLLLKNKFSENYLLSIRLYLVLLISSFIVPLLFTIFSPYMVWFKHFFDVKNLIFIIGLILIISFTIEILFNKFSSKFFLIIFYTFILIGHTSYYSYKISNKYLSNKQYWNDMNKVIIIADKLLNKNSTNNIFSNSNIINNYYILKNQNITYPDGFVNALNDKQMENLMINSYKSIGYSESEFRKLLKNKISWRSYNEIFQISHLKYQFNYLNTYFDIQDYEYQEIKFLKNRNLFLSESIALSKNEINRLVEKFINHNILYNIEPNIVIIDKKEFNMDFTLSKNYTEIFETKFFRLLNKTN
tara:strand:+ start:8053 stop:9882 length:1830 start_codon:yes stop_codon:yes gene_type:complete